MQYTDLCACTIRIAREVVNLTGDISERNAAGQATATGANGYSRDALVAFFWLFWIAIVLYPGGHEYLASLREPPGVFEHFRYLLEQLGVFPQGNRSVE
jgi:hypothetical protein